MGDGSSAQADGLWLGTAAVARDKAKRIAADARSVGDPRLPEKVRQAAAQRLRGRVGTVTQASDAVMLGEVVDPQRLARAFALALALEIGTATLSRAEARRALGVGPEELLAVRRALQAELPRGGQPIHDVERLVTATVDKALKRSAQRPHFPAPAASAVVAWPARHHVCPSRVTVRICP